MINRFLALGLLLAVSPVVYANEALEKVAPVLILPEDWNIHSDSVIITLVTETEGAVIYYDYLGKQLDSVTGTLYTGPIHVYLAGPRSEWFRAIAYKAGMEPSDITNRVYVYRPPMEIREEIVEKSSDNASRLHFDALGKVLGVPSREYSFVWKKTSKSPQKRFHFK